MASATATPSLVWRNTLRTWLSATLTIGILLWAGRGEVMMLGLLMAVLFINENDLTPARSLGQTIGGALIGILTAVVLKQFSNAWPMLGIGLLVTGALVRGLGLLKGLSMGYLSCWSVELIGAGKTFTWALIFNLTLAVVVGIAMAQLATWVFWPRQPLAQLPQLEQGLCRQLAAQIAGQRHWLLNGGLPPQALRSQELLPQIQQLQELRTPAATGRALQRWAQAGDLWRQVLRQWLLLEPLLLQLHAPLSPVDEQRSLLLASLHNLEQLLLAAAPLTPVSGDPSRWLEEANQLQCSRPLLLSLAQQTRNLEGLLQSRRHLLSAIDQLGSPAP